MSEILKKPRARNVFYGGSLFFVLIFAGLILGKHVRERHSCITCHTLHGEGACFAPEVGNVMTRWGVQDDPDAAADVLKGWMEAQPHGIEGRRQMPRFALTDEEIRALSEVLRWADQTDTQNGHRTTRAEETGQ